MPRRTRATILTPRERRIDDRGQHRERGVVAAVEREGLPRISEAVSMDFVAPAGVPANRLRVRFQHHFVGVEPVPELRGVWTVDPVAVELAWQDAGDIAVPEEVGLLRQR